MKRLIYIFCLPLVFVVLGSAIPPSAINYEFAIGLAPNYGDLSTFAICGISKGKIVRVVKFSRESFIAQVGGQYESSANPDGENLFEKYDVPNCYWPNDPDRFKHSCPSVDHLWKLRYQAKPGAAPGESTTLEGGSGGWAGKPRAPSESQLSILKRYGIDNLNDFAVGDDAFQLLKDIQNPSWQASYR